jgi:hypothetical protein
VVASTVAPTKPYRGVAEPVETTELIRVGSDAYSGIEPSLRVRYGTVPHVAAHANIYMCTLAVAEESKDREAMWLKPSYKAVPRQRSNIGA